MPFDHRSIRANVALMLSLQDPKSALPVTNRRENPSLCTLLLDINDDKADKRARTTLLKSEGLEDGNEEARPKMEQTKTAVVAGSKQLVENVVPSSNKMEAVIATKIDGTTEQMLVKEI